MPMKHENDIFTAAYRLEEKGNKNPAVRSIRRNHPNFISAVFFSFLSGLWFFAHFGFIMICSCFVVTVFITAGVISCFCFH